MVLTSAKLDPFFRMEKRILDFYIVRTSISAHFFFFEPGGDANDAFFFKFHFFSTVVKKSCYIYKLLLLMLFQVFNETINEENRNLSYLVALFSNDISLIMFGNSS